jgi:DAK2 domain fusion protein YloV
LEQAKITAPLFLSMMRTGAAELTNNVDKINALNIFPVPDGDTGTNMNLTLTSGVAEMEKRKTEVTVGKLAEALSKGLLMGARGNSGVILSQIFRGFAKSVLGKESIGVKELAAAFQYGVETAYKAVIKPVEGTILTVAREAAEAGIHRVKTASDPLEIVVAVLQEAKRSLSRTPELLPVLKQAGVVDAGGQGLVCIYEGMRKALAGEQVTPELSRHTPSLEDLTQKAHAGAMIDPATIEHGYCTEFMIYLTTKRRKIENFEETRFREEISRYGDSLLTVSDEELVKVHIHAESPGEVLNYAMNYGDLTHIKIDNMREQFENITGVHVINQQPNVDPAKEQEQKPYGIVAVATGEGIQKIFQSIGVDAVIGGGQSMNPSTEDLVKAVESISAKQILILPNNKNIILTAEQVNELVDVPVSVIPTKTIPQGISVLFAFDEEKDITENVEKMNQAISSVQSGEVTYAVRDTVVDGLTIQKDDFLGIQEGKIVTTSNQMLETAYQLLLKMMTPNTDVVTLLYGMDVTEEQANILASRIRDTYPNVEVEIYEGEQPLYYFLFAVE